jgi:hypothetical protein
VTAGVDAAIGALKAWPLKIVIGVASAPVSFVLYTAMEVAEETLQCSPDPNKMLASAVSNSLVFLKVPVCPSCSPAERAAITFLMNTDKVLIKKYISDNIIDVPKDMEVVRVEKERGFSPKDAVEIWKIVLQTANAAR